MPSRARKAAQPQAGQPAKAVIAVEGYMDVIALAQAGFAQAVAPLGTALTEDQLDLLWRMSPEPILCFDGDNAGIKAAHRAIDLALPVLKPGRSLRFAVLPEGKDPDDLVKVSGPQAFQAVLDDARPLADMLWARETSGGVFDTPERRAELEARLKQMTALIGDENVRRHYAQDVRERIQQFFGSDQRSNDGATMVSAATTRTALASRMAMASGAGAAQPMAVLQSRTVWRVRFWSRRHRQRRRCARPLS